MRWAVFGLSVWHWPMLRDAACLMAVAICIKAAVADPNWEPGGYVNRW